ncbi:MAG: hypothetical protein WCG36_06535 [bacterium]
MNIKSGHFRVEEGRKVRLDKWPTQETLRDLKMQYPQVGPERRRELRSIRNSLVQ